MLQILMLCVPFCQNFIEDCKVTIGSTNLSVYVCVCVIYMPVLLSLLLSGILLAYLGERRVWLLPVLSQFHTTAASLCLC